MIEECVVNNHGTVLRTLCLLLLAPRMLLPLLPVSGGLVWLAKARRACSACCLTEGRSTPGLCLDPLAPPDQLSFSGRPPRPQLWAPLLGGRWCSRRRFGPELDRRPLVDHLL